MILVLIAATAIVVTVLPVLRRSLQGARPSERQALLPWRRERPRPGRSGSDQRSVLSRWNHERQSLRQPEAGPIEDGAEVERQVRDQLYGPGFRRR